MEATQNNNSEAKINRILQLALQLVHSGTELSTGAPYDESQLDLILNRLGDIQQELKDKTDFIEARTARLNTLVEVLLQYTIMDFKPKADISQTGDEIDAVALGINTLGEELESHIQLLQESEANFRRLIAGVKDHAIFMIDPEGYVINWNSGAQRIKGYSAKEIIGKHISVFYTPEELEKNDPGYNLRMARENGTYETEGWRVRKDGSKFWADVIFTALYDDYGNIRGFSKITRDITVRKKNESEILEKSRALERSNKQLEQFVYIASHDMKEPLRTLSNYINLFQSDYSATLDKTGLKYFDRINIAIARMELLIHDLLEYARLGHKRDIKAVDCQLLVTEILADLDTLIAENETTIKYTGLPVIYADHSGIKSVFQNILNNAIKFRKKNVPPVITITATDSDFEWTFALADNGIGIEKQFQERIFSIFQKLHSHKEYPGTGIGLAQCKKIIEEHGGRIWIDAEAGKGSTFYFTILKPGNEKET